MKLIVQKCKIGWGDGKTYYCTRAMSSPFSI